MANDCALTVARARIDCLLGEVGRAKLDLAVIEVRHEAEREALAKRYEPATRPLRERIEACDKEIKKLALAHRISLFGDGDFAKLPNGLLYYRRSERVTRVRNMLATLQEIGNESAIVLTPSVNWDVIETWTDDQLTAVGTERKTIEKIEYAANTGGGGGLA